MTLELGGKSPNIILPDADLEAAIKGSFQAIYFNSGQACNAGSRLFVQQGPVRRRDGGARRRAPKATRSARASTPRRSSARSSRAEQHDRVSGYIEQGKAEGAELVAGGGRPRRRRLLRRADAVQRHRATTSRSPARRSSARCSSPCPTTSIEEVARRANDTEYGLAAGVWTRDVVQRPPARRAAARRLVYVNTWSASTRRRRSAASRPRASAASTATTGSTRTSRPRRSGSAWAPSAGPIR